MPDPNVPTVFLDRIKEARVSVSLSVLGAFIVTAYFTGIQVNEFYVGWHDDRYALKAEALTLAQVQPIREQIQKTQQTADETSEKLDDVAQQIEGIEIFLAVQEARELQLALTEHERHNDNSDAWRRERDRLKQQLADAIEYRDCLRRREANCEHLRNW